VSARKRILTVSDDPQLYTGFANVHRHLINYLLKTGKWEIAAVGWFHQYTAPEPHPPIPKFTTLKTHQHCCKRPNVVELTGGKEIQYFQVHGQWLVPDPGPQCTQGGVIPEDKYGFGSLPAIINYVQPDIVWTIGDRWMTTMHYKFPNRRSYKLVNYVPIDGDPTPHITKQGSLVINWPETFKDDDILVAYGEYGMREINAMARRYGYGDLCHHWIPHGVDTSVFRPVSKEKRLEVREKVFKAGPNDFVIGFVSRNQPRKLWPQIVEAISIIKKRGLEDPKRPIKLYLHFPKQDVGWNVDDMIDYWDAHEWAISRPDLAVGVGPPDEQLAAIMSSCDAIVHIATGEGFGLSVLEAMACGTPVVSSNYSALSDWPRGTVLEVKPAVLVPEPLTNIRRFYADMDDLVDKIMRIYKDRRLRKELSKKGLRRAKELDWSGICEQWGELLDGVDITGRKPYPKRPANLPQRKLINLLDYLDPNDKFRILYTMPESAGDVLLSTGVVRAIANKFPEARIYFATDERYAGILDGNKDIYRVIPYSDDFLDFRKMETIFQISFNPHFWTQKWDNWTQGGTGKHFAHLYASACNVSLADPWIRLDPYNGPLPEKFITFNSGSRVPIKNYHRWDEVIPRIGVPVVQIGARSDPLVEGCIDLRGRTTWQQSAWIISKAMAHLGVDSFPGHLAATVRTRSVVLFSNNYPHLAGPLWGAIAVEPRDRLGCTRPCHLVVCKRRKEGCVDNIDPEDVCAALAHIIGSDNILPPVEKMTMIDPMEWRYAL